MADRKCNDCKVVVLGNNGYKTGDLCTSCWDARHCDECGGFFEMPCVMFGERALCRNCIPRITFAIECVVCSEPTDTFGEKAVTDIGVICKACRDDCYYRVRPGRTLRNKSENSD